MWGKRSPFADFLRPPEIQFAQGPKSEVDIERHIGLPP
jgi:hypothetical protein